MRFTVEKHGKVFLIEDHGWEGPDCPKDTYPRMAIELKFRTRYRAESICQMLNSEWREFEIAPF